MALVWVFAAGNHRGAGSMLAELRWCSRGGRTRGGRCPPTSKDNF